MPSIIFPLEIEEKILDYLAEEDESHSAMKICSLVCQAFLPICRKHIFGSIVLIVNHDDGGGFPPLAFPTTRAFERLLRETPEITDYIRKLDFTIQIAGLTSFESSIQESLKRISRLEFLSVRHKNRPRLDWSNNPIRPALLHLLHLPTLTHFAVSDINFFTVSDLIPCVNLKCLDISYLTLAAENSFPATLPEHSIQLNELVAEHGASAAIILKLYSARRPDGRPIIDFGSLSKIKVSFAWPHEGRTLQELFRHCRVLTNVSISFWHPQYFKPGPWPSIADMLQPSMETLKHIVVDIYRFVGVRVDFPEFEDMRTKNIIETVTIRVRRMNVLRCRGLENNWGSLDEVLTSPGWFSLMRVTLILEVVNCFGTDNDLETLVALRKLPETQFPRLSSSKSISFDFEVIIATE